MVICPKCKAENRPEAAFCSRCGTILFAQPVSAKTEDQPAEASPAAQLAPARLVEPVATSVASGELNRSPAVSAPAIPQGFIAQPAGTLFADRFRSEALLVQGEHEIRYTVSETAQPGSLSVRICSNPDCRTIHCPVGEEPEKYCTQCGQPLEDRSLIFLLQEADNDRFAGIQEVIDLHLVHPNILPPVASFQQEFAGETRHYLVTPYADNMPPEPEVAEVLDWGAQLAGALDYLQSKGVALGDEVDLSSIGLVENKAVWRNFSSVRILPMLADGEKINNMRLLGLVMYTMMTGRTAYSIDPYLPPAINDLFQKVLLGEGFTSGADFARQIEEAKSSGAGRLALDYQIGKRCHAGKVRMVNEDSLLSVEFSMMQQKGISPYGVFAVADGMGGHASGDLASSLVVNSIASKVFEIGSFAKLQFSDSTEWVKKLVQAANLAVYEARQKAGNDMGSTLAVACLVGTQAYLSHQGDSRIYLINSESIEQLTVDHSLVQHMVDIGKISSEEARYHPQKNVIYLSLGDKPYVEVECINRQLFPHDRLLLCSDGLTNLLEDEMIRKIILEASSPQAACDHLIEAANLAGGEDNISIILVEVIIA